MKTSFARNAIILGLLSAVGPLAIDMYLPALPTIAEDLQTSPAAVQGSLMAFFLAVAACQIVYGPISDSFGRKLPLYFGTTLYCVAAIGCSLSQSIEALIAWRFIQGIGACASMTIPRAIVRDLHTGHDAARLMSLNMLVFSVVPILAPLLGSAITEFGGWREIFWFIAAMGVLALALAYFLLPETRQGDARVSFSLRAIGANYWQLLTDRNYLGVTFIGAFGMSSFFAFLAGSSFVYIDHFGLTPTQYSLMFAVNAIAFIGSAQFSSFLARRFGLRQVVSAALTFYLVVTWVLLTLTLAGVDSMLVMAALLFLGFGAMGLVIPSTAVLALDNYGPTAGTAAALMGTLQLVVAAGVIGIVGAFSTGTQVPMLSAIATCALIAFIIGRFTLSKRHAGA